MKEKKKSTFLFKLLIAKYNLFYLKTQGVPRSKHSSSHL